MSIYDTPAIGERIAGNSYVGRGIVIGQSADGKKAVFRRPFKAHQQRQLLIHPFDASKVKDPSLIIYSPVRLVGNAVVVTNGDQTDTICDFLAKGSTFEAALETREFEPDAPNYTPRISGILFPGADYTYKLNILKSADADGTACNRYTFSYKALPGVGHFIHTYNHDGNPIPTFTGEPERISIPDDIDAFADDLWTNLDENNKISLIVRYIDLETGDYEDRLFNKNK